MNISIHHKDDLNASLTVNVEKPDYEAALEKSLRAYQKKANIPGFRPGKAPMGMINKMYGTSAKVEEVNRVTADSLNNYLKENNIEVLGQPVLSADNEVYDWAITDTFSFKFDIGLSPKFDLNVSRNDLFTKYVPAIDDELINKEVERIQQRFGSQVLAEQTEENDIVTVQGSELDEAGEALEGGVNAEFTVLVSSIKNEEVKNSFIGRKNGDIVTADIFEVFNQSETEIATVLHIGKETVNDLHKNFRMEIREIKRQESAPVNQELFDKAYGENTVTDEAAFRAKIAEELQQFYTGEADHALEHELLESLQNKHSIPLPDEFLKNWLMDRHPDKFTAENVDQKYEPEARYLKSTLFQEKVISDQGIKIEDEDILNASLAYTKRMFFGYNLNLPVNDYMMNYAKEQLKDANYRSRMLNMAIENRVLEALKSMATVEVKEVPMEEFRKKMREHSEQHHKQHEHAHEEAHSH